MPKNSNRDVVELADIAVSDLTTDGGYLNPMQANKFIRKVVDQPTILKDLRLVTMNAPVMEINKIGFGSRILRAAPASGTALQEADRAQPTTEQLTLTTKEIICEVRLPYDVLEDNIERENLEETVMDMIAENTAIDLEELVVQGDESSGDSYLALHDGMLERCTTHVVTYGSPPTLNSDIFKAGLDEMPAKFLRNKRAMRFYTSHHVELEYADSLAGRETTLGDVRIETDYANVLASFGVPVAPCATMPDTNYLFTNPKNFILGVQRKIQIETDKDITTRVYIIVLTMRVAMAIEEIDACVKCTGLIAAPTTTTT